MDEIKRQVNRAQRRLVMQQFIQILPQTLLASLVVALIAVAVPKIWPLSLTSTFAAGTVWTWSWIGGAAGAGLLAAIVWTFLTRSDALNAALEIDRRFELKERVSSVLALDERDVETEAGRALVEDAIRKVSEIEVDERFRTSFHWRTLLPLPVALAAILLGLGVGYATKPETADTKADELKLEATHIQTSEDQFKKRLDEQIKQAEEEGLTDAAALLKELEQQYEARRAQGERIDRKETLVRLNDLKQEIESRQKQLGDRDKLKKQLDQLNKTEQGPAENTAQALKKADFQQARNEIEKLQDQLAKNDLTDEQKQQLADQLQQMGQQVNDLVKRHRQAEADLEQQLKQAEAAGDRAQADQLQQRLDELTLQDRQMNQLEKLAQKMGDCSKCLQPGEGQPLTEQQLADAAANLDEIAAQLQEMQSEMDELQTLDNVKDLISQTKESLNCKQCNGAGCAACQGQQGLASRGNGQPGEQPGDGLGEGLGQGQRPEEKTATGIYESKVAAEPKPGEVVRTGDADGPNIAGRTRAEVRQEVNSSTREETDPLSNQQLPRAQREHARQYFEQFNNRGQK